MTKDFRIIFKNKIYTHICAISIQMCALCKHNAKNEKNLKKFCHRDSFSRYADSSKARYVFRYA